MASSIPGSGSRVPATSGMFSSQTCAFLNQVASYGRPLLLTGLAVNTGWVAFQRRAHRIESTRMAIVSTISALYAVRDVFRLTSKERKISETFKNLETQFDAIIQKNPKYTEQLTKVIEIIRILSRDLNSIEETSLREDELKILEANIATKMKEFETELPSLISFLLTEAEKLQADFECVTEELAHVKEENKALSAKNKELKLDKEELEAQLDRVNEENKAKLASLTAEKTKLQAKVERVIEENRELKAEVASLVMQTKRSQLK